MSMRDLQKDVLEFHRLIQADIESHPRKPRPTLREARIGLLSDEYNEAVTACRYTGTGSIAKELCDVIYTAIGLANVHGIDLEPVWNATHQSNMDKGPQDKPRNGVVPKPQGWQKPDTQSIVDAQTINLQELV